MTNSQRTPMTNDQQTPIINDQRTSMTNDQWTPITNKQQTSMTNYQRTTMTNNQRTPTTNDPWTPMTNEERTPMTNKWAPPNKERGTPVNDERWTPLSGLQMPNDVTPFANVARSGKPKAAAQLFSGMQAPGYVALLAKGVDDNDDLSFSRVLCGAIRDSYDCSEDANEDDMRHVESGTCSRCAFYKTQNEELREQLQSLKQKCASKYKLS